MASQKITELTALAAADVSAGDLIPVADVSATATKSVRADNLLDALLRQTVISTAIMYRAGNTVAVVQPGGTPGTHEVRVSHTGSHAYIDVRAGNLFVQFGGFEFGYFDSHGGTGGRLALTTSAGSAERVTISAGDQIVGLATGGQFAWSNNSSASWQTKDTGLSRAAAGVVGLTNGSTGRATLASVALTPAQITSNQNDYAPGTARTLRLSSDASRNITGLVAGADGQELFAVNVGSNDIVLVHQSASSAAANRFLNSTGADITVTPNNGVGMWYDATTQRWRVYA